VFNRYYGENVSEEGMELIKMIQKSSNNLRLLIDGVLDYSQSDAGIEGQTESINTAEFFTELGELYNATNNFKLNLTSNTECLDVNKTAISQVLMNLISNAIRYNDKDAVIIDVAVEATPEYYHFDVSDNGKGIEPSKIDSIFQLFQTDGKDDRFGQKGTGIGLSTVQKIVEKLGGKIQVSSTVGVGTTFSFTIKAPAIL
jgi:signal transduction histidine kinase